MGEKVLHSAKLGKQLSVFVEDQPGTLAAITGLLGKHGINIYALTLAEGLGHGYVRMVVDKHDEAMKVLRAADELTMERDVILLELSNMPGSLGRVAGALGAAGVNLEYAYCAGGPSVDKGLVIVRADDCEKALKVLQKLL
jgi:hypothetical protein